MLECQGFVLRPWTKPARPAPEPTGRDQGEAPVRAILDAATLTPLGFARRAGTAPGWAGWFGRPGIEVFETEDASLLCTVHPRWGLPRWWEVRDADGHPVGAVRPRLHTTRVEDRSGQLLARIERTPPGAPGRVVAPDGREIATLRAAADGTAVAFAPSSPDNPFTRMVLLAALLTTEG
jgi:hypothetical protein